ncbi:protein SRG1-like [Arachis stenosperma]|uniref:protein SRG1-like n=1 Tax=Arachis stenosperma TaxID=217475 RepID=UPI0025ABAD52|nr:protein SRG1-like [Arachis stenosperma]XP_057759775.1 protein SRG1-like [Arachis stenosperma]
MSKIGSSLLVPSVQELAKQSITQVPDRYLVPKQDTLIIPKTSSFIQVPIIDLNKLLSKDAFELHKLDHACKEWGFFQLINHGVDPSLIESVKLGFQDFFNLPIEEKKKLWQKPGDIEGFGQLFVVSEKQKLEWADLFIINTLPSYARDLNLFLNIPQPFRDNLDSYSLQLGKLFMAIIGHMEMALKTKPNELLKLFEDVSQSMRLNYYPPCPQPENVIGLKPHSDAGSLTILLQANEVDGLQIRKDGMWMPITPLSNAFIINVGDILEILTNGIYQSIEHRVTINSKKERISIAAFHKPQMNKVISPIESLITSERPALFRRISVADYYKKYFSRQLQEKSILNDVRIKSDNCVHKIL